MPRTTDDKMIVINDSMKSCENVKIFPELHMTTSACRTAGHLAIFCRRRNK